MSKSHAVRLILRLLVVVAMQQQQLLIYKRQIKRPKLRKGDRLFWVLCRKFFPRIWQKVLAIVQPDTVIRWHRDLARLRWKWISKNRAVRKNKIPQETRDLVRNMAEENPRWGAERIRGELLKLGIRLGKRTIQKLIRPVRKRPQPSGKQSWKTFIANHAPDIWASDFFTVWTLGFKQLYVFVVFAIHTREILHWNVTEYPDSEWTYRQILCTTWDRKAPRFLICDRDNKYSGRQRRMVKERLGIRVLRTPYRAPKANAFAERVIGTLRRECLDHFLILSEDHLREVLRQYIDYYNNCRPHQGIEQRIPGSDEDGKPSTTGEIRSRPILNGLHHHYFRKAA